MALPMLDQITVYYDHFAASPDIEAVAGTVTFTLDADRDDATIPSTAGDVTIRPVVGYIGADGQLRRDNPAGAVGVELVGNDAALSLLTMVYKATFDLTTLIGDPVPRKPIRFNVNRGNTAITLHEWAPVPGVRTTGIARGEAGQKGADGHGWLVFTEIVGDGTANPIPLVNQHGTRNVQVHLRRLSDGKVIVIDNTATEETVTLLPDIVLTEDGYEVEVWAKSDSEPPSAPTGLTIGTESDEEIPMTWTAATDNVGIDHYRIWRAAGHGQEFDDAEEVGTSASTSFTDDTVTADHNYTYFVTALDAVGNESGPSTGADATSTASPDVTNPSAPSGLTVGTTTTTTVPLSWSAATDNIGVDHYRVWRAAGSGASFGSATVIATPSGLSYTDTEVLPLHTYTYFVTAVDAAANEGTPTAGANATTKYRAHYDANLLIDLDVDSLVGSLSNGDQVSSITPTAGSEGAHAFTQGTSANRPLFNTAVKNGHAALTFDDTNDYIDATWTNQHGPGATSPSAVTVIAVARFDQNTDNLFTGIATNVGLTLARNSGAPTMRAGNATGGTITHTYTSGTWAIFVCVFDGASSKLLINETSGGTSGTVGVSSGSPIAGSYLGGMRIGASNTPGNYFSGQLCRLMAIGDHVSDANIAIEVAALGGEYAITVS